MTKDKIPAEVELYLEREKQAERERNISLFSAKWVEKAFSWALYTIGGMIITGLILSAIQYIK